MLRDPVADPAARAVLKKLRAHHVEQVAIIDQALGATAAEPKRDRSMELKKASGVYDVTYGRLRRWCLQHGLGRRKGWPVDRRP